jgi:hypothetical protein
MSKRGYRKSITGVRMLEADRRVEITLCTLCPTKWVIIDTESSHVYGKGNKKGGWVEPSLSRLRDARIVLDRLISYRTDR